MQLEFCLLKYVAEIMPLIIQMFQCMFIPTLELLIKYNYYQYAPMVFSQCFLFILLAQVRQVICLS